MQVWLPVSFAAKSFARQKTHCFIILRSMNKALVAEVISVGTELLLGEIVDTNATFLAARLCDLGIALYRKHTIGDNLARLSQGIEQALERSDIVILGGGLGPTEDDITREAIAAVLGEEPAVDDQLLAALKNMFADRNHKMADCNKKQAWLINSATALKNPHGTAFGWLVNHKGKIIVALPGPPFELQSMWIEKVEPLLPRSASVLFHRTIRTIGLGESDLVEKIPEFTRLERPGVGTYCRACGIDVRVAVAAPKIEEAEAIVKPVVDQISARLAPWIYGFDDETVVSAIMKALLKKGESFACMESITGGALSAEITACPGVSSCYKGSVIAYSNEVKISFGVDAEIISSHGAVSAQTAMAMARTAKKLLNSDWGVATTGVAGPTELEGKAPGYAWVAASGPGGEFDLLVNWPGERTLVQGRVCKRALQLLFTAVSQK